MIGETAAVLVVEEGRDEYFHEVCQIFKHHFGYEPDEACMQAFFAEAIWPTHVKLAQINDEHQELLFALRLIGQHVRS